MGVSMPRFVAFGQRLLVALIAIALASRLTRAQGSDAPLMPLPPVQEAPSGVEVQTVGWLSDEEPTGDDSLQDISERLEMLEQSYCDLQRSYNELRKRVQGCVRPGHDGVSMTMYGMVHPNLWGFPSSSPGVNGFETGDPMTSPQDEVGFRRARLGVRGSLLRNMVYKFEMEFAEGNDPEFRDVYVGWKDLSLLQTLVVGNMKRPYGLDHLNSSRDNVFMERPLVVDGFNQDARRLGICCLGYSDSLVWNWRFGVFNQRLIQDEGSYRSDNWQPQLAGRLANTLWYEQSSDGRRYAHWAVAGTWADPAEFAVTENYAGSGISEARFQTRPEARTFSRWLDTGVIGSCDDYTLLAAEAVLNLGPFQVVGEYQSVRMNRIGASDLNFNGAYGYISYFLTGEHMPWDRKTGTLGRVEPLNYFFVVDPHRCGKSLGMGAWQVAARWSYADFADEDIQGGYGQSVTLGVNWYWTPLCRVQMNYLFGQIEQNADNAAAGAPDYGSYQMLGTQFMVDF